MGPGLKPKAPSLTALGCATASIHYFGPNPSRLTTNVLSLEGADAVLKLLGAIAAVTAALLEAIDGPAHTSVDIKQIIAIDSLRALYADHERMVMRTSELTMPFSRVDGFAANPSATLDEYVKSLPNSEYSIKLSAVLAAKPFSWSKSGSCSVRERSLT